MVKPSEEEAVAFTVPPQFPQPAYRFSDNPVTPAGFALGRTLFYDGRLSRDGSISCADCHQQPAAFSHFDHNVSHGIEDRLGTRNSPALFNLAWHREFFWDGGVHDLDLQPPNAIEHPNEMGEKLGNVLEKLRQDPKMLAQFKAAFGTEEVTTARFLKALSQFMVMLISADAKYDRYIQGKGVSLSAEELKGLEVFKAKCQTCHPAPLFTDLQFRNTGLLLRAKPDEARALITLNPDDRYKFKVPSLRNVAVTQPYMHDGRFKTLAQVLDHYAEGVQDLPNLDPILQQANGKRGIALSEGEKQVLIAFLKTLTDETFLKDQRFTQP